MARVLASRAVGGAYAARPLPSSLPLTLTGIWRAFWAEPWSFKWLCLYVFFEYVRPQQIYPILQFLPWAKLTIAAACLALIAEGLVIRSKTIANWLLLLFAVVVLLSSALAYVPSIAFDKIDVMANWLIVFFLLANTLTDQRKFYLFLVFFLLWSTKMSQHGARSFLMGFGGAGGAPGWFQNSGEFALQMCIYVPLSLHAIMALRPMLSKPKLALLALLPISGVLGIVGSSSRGGLLAMACIGLWMLLRSRRKMRGLLALAVATPIIWFAIPQYQKERFRTAGEDETSRSRLLYWKRGLEMANSRPAFGVGYENWAAYYRDRYPLKEGDHVRWIAPGQYIVEVSHNSFIEVVSQLGYVGLVVFVVIIGSIWRINRRTRRVLAALGERARFLREMSYALDSGVIGFVVAGFFMAVAFYPFVWFQIGMAAALNAAALRMAAADGTGVTPPTRMPSRMQTPAGAVPRVAGWRSRRRVSFGTG